MTIKRFPGATKEKKTKLETTVVSIADNSLFPGGKDLGWACYCFGDSISY